MLSSGRLADCSRMSLVGIMENEMETTIVYWGYIGIMENKMETRGLQVSSNSNQSSTYHRSCHILVFMAPRRSLRGQKFTIVVALFLSIIPILPPYNPNITGTLCTQHLPYVGTTYISIYVYIYIYYYI